MGRVTGIGSLLAMGALSMIAVTEARPQRPVDRAPAIAELWQEPTDLSTRNLFDGPWGASNAPYAGETFTFQRRKHNGTNPGMTVVDPRGRVWHIKQGREGPPEVVVSRILSAVGYHQPPVYFLPSISVMRGSARRTEPGGRVRLSMTGLTHRGDWIWEDSPFVGTPPYQGLLVILVILNSADLKNVNNALYDVTAGSGDVHRWFVVRDLGTSFGSTGRFDPTPNNLQRFSRNRFITGVDGGYVRFDYEAVHRNLLARITPADVRWASELLSRLSDTQWHDAFRAGGYAPAVAAGFVQRIRQKIDEGCRIGL
jgi:hypothetical protein